jgi:hypothetical protein
MYAYADEKTDIYHYFLSTKTNYFFLSVCEEKIFILYLERTVREVPLPVFERSFNVQFEILCPEDFL